MQSHIAETAIRSQGNRFLSYLFEKVMCCGYYGYRPPRCQFERRRLFPSPHQEGTPHMADLTYLDYTQNPLPKCPHCGTDFEVWEDDNPSCLSYEDGGQTMFECKSCRKDFCCVTCLGYTFSTAVDDTHADDQEWGPQKADAA